jgi:NADPH-dependent F420 reductase
MTKIAIIGKGNVGSALAATFTRAGYEVTFGVRPESDATEAIAKTDGKAEQAPAAEAAAWGDVVVLAVPGGAALAITEGLGDLSGKVVIDCANPLQWDAGPVWNPPAEGSLAAAIAAAAPGAKVVKAFNTFGAEFHADPKVGDTGANVFIATDDAEARKLVSSICDTCGFVPVDAGPLRNASVLENVAMMWIHLAMVGGQGRDFVLNLVRR